MSKPTQEGAQRTKNKTKQKKERRKKFEGIQACSIEKKKKKESEEQKHFNEDC